MKMFNLLPLASLAGAITMNQLLTQYGCRQLPQNPSQVSCPDGSVWAIETSSRNNAFAYYNDPNEFPVVAPHGKGAGQVCSAFNSCTTCAGYNGCVWATGKCISDDNCFGDPYCAASTYECSGLSSVANTRSSTGGFMIINGVEVAAGSQGVAGFQWPASASSATASSYGMNVYPGQTFSSKPSYYGGFGSRSGELESDPNQGSQLSVEQWLALSSQGSGSEYQAQTTQTQYQAQTYAKDPWTTTQSTGSILLDSNFGWSDSSASVGAGLSLFSGDDWQYTG